RAVLPYARWVFAPWRDWRAGFCVAAAEAADRRRTPRDAAMAYFLLRDVLAHYSLWQPG
ncbi:unnamed protein product, partial [Amoebophrya sp. A120]